MNCAGEYQFYGGLGLDQKAIKVDQIGSDTKSSPMAKEGKEVSYRFLMIDRVTIV